MSQPRLHRNEILDVTKTELDSAGFLYREEAGGKHGRLVVDVNGREESVIISGTPSDRRAMMNQRALVRRKIKEWKSEMEPQQIELPVPSGSLVYNNVEIGERDEMLSLTDMWRAAGSDRSRRPVQWLRSKSGVDFVDEMSKKVSENHLLQIGNGRNGQTFAHWQIGMAYAQYLSPEFHAWCNTVVRRHMTGEAGTQEYHVPAVANDDTSALLELLSDMQSALMGAVQRSDSRALDRVEDVKAALLHYMKVQLKEPSYAFFDDVRARNKAAFDRDTMVIREMRQLTAAINGLVKKTEQPLLSQSFVFVDWYDHDRIYRDFFPNQDIPNRRFLSQAITKSLDAYCKKRQRGQDMQSRRIGGRNVNLWHKDSVEHWVKLAGQEMVRKHLAKSRRDPVVVSFAGVR